jgi:endoglucanase
MGGTGGGGTGGGGTGGGGTGGAPIGLHLQYKAADTNANDNQIKPEFIIVNDGQVSVPLGELSIRYWFTNDGGQMNFFCDYALVTCGQVMGTFMAASGANTDTALVVTFSGATMIGPGQTSGEVKTRLHKTDFALLNEANDYSFDPTKTNYTDWAQVGLYHNGNLVWGVEP